METWDLNTASESAKYIVLTNLKLHQIIFLVKQRCELQNPLNMHVLLHLKHKSALPDVVFPLS